MALKGTLEDMPLSDLFQVFRIGPKTGVLFLAHGALYAAIYVAKGRLVDAVLMHKSERKAVASQEEAVIQTLLWDGGSFLFRHDARVEQRPVRIRHSAEWLVLTGLRRRSDLPPGRPYLQITPETRLRPTSRPLDADDVELNADQQRVLRAAAGSPDLRTMSQMTGIEWNALRRVVGELMAIGLLELAPTPATPRMAKRRDAIVSLPDVRPTRDGVVAHRSGVSSVTVGRSLIEAIMQRIRSL